jgi:hypothetical protein
MLKSLNPRLNKLFEQTVAIDSLGGTIVLGDSAHGFSTLVIPANALTNSVNINFWWESNNFTAEFSPHGTTFNVPVTMELSYEDADLSGIDENDLKIYYYNEDTEVWELIGDDVDTVEKTVTGHTDHFSRYAIGIDP